MSQFKSLNKGAGIPASYDTMRSIVRMKQFLLSLKSEIGRETGKQKLKNVLGKTQAEVKEKLRQYRTEKMRNKGKCGKI